MAVRGDLSARVDIELEEMLRVPAVAPDDGHGDVGHNSLGPRHSVSIAEVSHARARVDVNLFGIEMLVDPLGEFSDGFVVSFVLHCWSYFFIFLITLHVPR